jgi:hypothetical protein
MLVIVSSKGADQMRWLEESTTFQAIKATGAVAEARRILVLVGEEKLGRLSERAMAAIYAEDDIVRLENLCKRLLVEDSWEALLGLPPRRRRNSRQSTNP